VYFTDRKPSQKKPCQQVVSSG